MSKYEKMLVVKSYLESVGIECIVPKEEDDAIHNLSDEQFIAFKKKVSNAYLKKIRNRDTYAVLVINDEKRGIDNYIGANTFVEVAMGFCWNRKVFLLNDYYEPYMDELIAWDVQILKGDLGKLVESYNADNGDVDSDDNTEQLITS